MEGEDQELEAVAAAGCCIAEAPREGDLEVWDPAFWGPVWTAMRLVYAPRGSGEFAEHEATHIRGSLGGRGGIIVPQRRRGAQRGGVYAFRHPPLTSALHMPVGPEEPVVLLDACSAFLLFSLLFP